MSIIVGTLVIIMACLFARWFNPCMKILAVFWLLGTWAIGVEQYRNGYGWGGEFGRREAIAVLLGVATMTLLCGRVLGWW